MASTKDGFNSRFLGTKHGFSSCFLEVLSEIPEEIKNIQGIVKLNPLQVSDEYLAEVNVADISIDPNSNVYSKSPVNHQAEMFKPQNKLIGYYEIWRAMRDNFSESEANEALIAMVNGTLYFHDITKINVPYCFAFDTGFIASQGRPYGWLPGVPPKRSSSFIGQVIETTMDYSQQLAGACGVPNILVNLAYYTRKERSQIHRYIDNFFAWNESKNIAAKNAITAIALFISGLGYTGSQFTMEPGIPEDIEDTIWKYINEYMGNDNIHFSIHKVADMAYDKYIEDLVQNFVHVMHNTFRIGGDSPFTNISIFDRYFISNFLKDSMYPDLSIASENKEEILKIQEIFVDFFIKGAPSTNKKYRFPVVTINVKKWTETDYEEGKCSWEDIGKVADREYFSWLLKKNLPRGTFNIHIGEKLATCCRLTSDLAKLKSEIRQDTFGNGGMSIGSHRVVAINLHRIALIAYETNTPYNRVLNKYLEMCEKVLIAHKELLKKRVDVGFLQFFNIGWCNLNQFFSTIGFTGLRDAYRVLALNQDIAKNKEEYIKICGDILDQMDKFADEAGARNEGYAFNVEEIPGENACPKLAAMDNYFYKNKDWYTPVDILSNQMVPLFEHLSLFNRLEIAGRLMNKVSGGSILHLNILDEMTEASNEQLNYMIIEDYNIPHYAINRGSSTCVNGHTTIGISWACPICDAEIQTHTIRIIGYDSDTDTWSEERREEFKQRQFYTASNLL